MRAFAFHSTRGSDECPFFVTAKQFFARFVAPRPPPGIRPKRSARAMHNVALPEVTNARSVT
jgi:hypothetical protein